MSDAPESAHNLIVQSHRFMLQDLLILNTDSEGERRDRVQILMRRTFNLHKCIFNLNDI